LIEKIIWLNNLNKEIEGKVLLFQIYCDNLSNIKILTNEKRTNSSRHFDIDYSFVMDYIKEDIINISHINSNNMLADILTKKSTRNLLIILLTTLSITNFSFLLFCLK